MLGRVLNDHGGSTAKLIRVGHGDGAAVDTSGHFCDRGVGRKSRPPLWRLPYEN